MEEKLRLINERMRRIDRKRLCLIERTVGDLDILPSQHFVLMQLSRAGRVTSQAQVAEMLHISPARVTLVMKQLDALGYIERVTGVDGRRNEIAITPKGEEMVAQSRAFFRKMDAESFAGFSDEELTQLSDYLDRVLDNLLRMEERAKESDEK